jgi:hypothetical protein
MDETATCGERSGRVLLAISLAIATFGLLAFFGGIEPAFSGQAAAPSEYEYGDRVLICHRTGSRSNPTTEITVSLNTLTAHLRHGDTIGPCP